MTIQLPCRQCRRPFAADRAGLLRGGRLCPACREADDAPRVATTAVWSERSRLWSLTVLR